MTLPGETDTVAYQLGVLAEAVKGLSADIKELKENCKTYTDTKMESCSSCRMFSDQKQRDTYYDMIVWFRAIKWLSLPLGMGFIAMLWEYIKKRLAI